MDILDHPSEIARFRAQQALEEQAMHYVQSGLAITTRHNIITAHAERGAEHILRLVAEGKQAEALALMNHPSWGEPVVPLMPEPCS
jgi:hypothetical protein